MDGLLRTCAPAPGQLRLAGFRWVPWPCLLSAYSNGPCREYLRRRGIQHTIPEKIDSQAARLRKGSRGGRPPGFDEDRYKKRNTVERAINPLKQSRAIATRYDKRGYVYLGTATAAALTIWLRT
ncbi:hypothetical protein [Streptomyces sp. 184]|uniref:hypothetical protein n=1 Tax=Streptomyces sp. 184 TaxID=1827526 RepID=UPI003891E3F2